MPTNVELCMGDTIYPQPQVVPRRTFSPQCPRVAWSKDGYHGGSIYPLAASRKMCDAVEPSPRLIHHSWTPDKSSGSGRVLALVGWARKAKKGDCLCRVILSISNVQSLHSAILIGWRLPIGRMLKSCGINKIRMCSGFNYCSYSTSFDMDSWTHHYKKNLTPGFIPHV